MGNFVGSTYNVSPLCQGCSNIEWADKQGYDFHQCEECKKTADEARELKPCPFCGRKVRLVNAPGGFKYDIWFIVHEEKEPICFLWHNRGYEGKRKDIVMLWNQRA